MQLKGLIGHYSERDRAFNQMVSERSKSEPRGAEDRGGRMPIGAEMEDGLNFFPPIDLIERTLENSKKGLLNGGK